MAAYYEANKPSLKSKNISNSMVFKQNILDKKPI